MSDDLDTNGSIQVTYFTDPLCCWSWAFEPQWRKFAFQYRNFISWRYCLGGLIPDWINYRDELNSVVRPAQFGPLWMEAHQVSGMPIDFSLWHREPPESSYPACIAVKCATLQAESLGQLFLRRARERVMIQGENIAKDAILLDIAEQLGEEASLDVAQFSADYFGDNGRKAFRKDWMEAKGLGISRFPTIVIKEPTGQSTLVSGYKTFAALQRALLFIAPELAGVEPVGAVSDYCYFWKGLTQREEQEFENPGHDVQSTRV